MFKNRNGEKKRGCIAFLFTSVSSCERTLFHFSALSCSFCLSHSATSRFTCSSLNRLFSRSLSSLPPQAFCYTGVVLLLRVLVFELSPFPSRSKVPSPRSLSMVAEEPADSGGCWGPEEDEVLRVALADAARFDLEREGSVPVMSAPPSPSFVGK